LNLLFAIILLLRAFPDDFSVELASRLNRSGVDRFPEFVGRSFGDDGDLKFCGFGLSALLGPSALSGTQPRQVSE
jgi:hypothetical protein